jgi:hypothetical protein
LEATIQAESLHKIRLYAPSDGIAALENQWQRAAFMKAYGARQTREPAAHDQNLLGSGFHFAAGIAVFNALCLSQKKPRDENPTAFF